MELQLLALRDFGSVVNSEYLRHSHPLRQFHMVKLGADDASRRTDSLDALKKLILANEQMYPGIGHWYTDKVVPSLKNGQRIAYVGFHQGKAMASAVLKRGLQAKLCHLRVDESLRGLDLGKLFFSQMAYDARDMAAEIHFTLPEGLWAQRSGFFKSFGFQDAIKARQQYRAGEAELACSAPLSTMWTRALAMLPDLRQGASPWSHRQTGEIEALRI